MSRTRALAATLALAPLLVAAAPAYAWPFGKKPAAEETAKPIAKDETKAPRLASVPESTEAAPAPPKPASPEQRAAAARLDPLAQAAFWQREFDVNPADADAGVRLAANLRAMGQTTESAAIAEQVLAAKPDHVEALYEFARARIAINQGFYAVAPLKRAQQLQPRDWRPLSMLGVALEQAQRLPEARVAWNQALALSPDNPAVLTNVALSYMAEGNADEAERMLRRAAARPDADIRVRQNLALVLGLRGRTAEAEQMLRQDLPPELVATNLAWLRARTGAAPRTWGSVTSTN